MMTKENIDLVLKCLSKKTLKILSEINTKKRNYDYDKDDDQFFERYRKMCTTHDEFWGTLKLTGKKEDRDKDILTIRGVFELTQRIREKRNMIDAVEGRLQLAWSQVEGYTGLCAHDQFLADFMPEIVLDIIKRPPYEYPKCNGIIMHIRNIIYRPIFCVFVMSKLIFMPYIILFAVLKVSGLTYTVTGWILSFIHIVIWSKLLNGWMIGWGEFNGTNGPLVDYLRVCMYADQREILPVMWGKNFDHKLAKLSIVAAYVFWMYVIFVGDLGWPLKVLFNM